jgi:hypothetical protein
VNEKFRLFFRKEMGGDWVTMGVLYYKAQHKSRRSGHIFSAWKLTDLRHSFKLKELLGTVPQSVVGLNLLFYKRISGESSDADVHIRIFSFFKTSTVFSSVVMPLVTQKYVLLLPLPRLTKY